MKILALEFSSPQRSVAVVCRETGLNHVYEAMENGPSTRPFALIESVLSQSGIEREEIEVVAVGLGPGSYTGIRTAISLAEGWQLAAPASSVIGVSTAEILAYDAWELGLRGVVHVAIDAQKHELYLGAFLLEEDGGVTEKEPLRIVKAAEAAELEKAGTILVGPEIRKWFGHGIALHPKAATLGRLASQRHGREAASPLEPIYLREPQFVKAPPPRVVPP